MSASYDFSGRIALVNGASRGIGAAIARALGACGARLILTSRKAESVEPVAAAIRESGGTAETFGCHAGRLDQIETLFTAVGERHGRLDLLVSLTRTFAKEHGADGIRVNAILPGVIETRFAAALTENPEVRGALEKTAAGRAGQPDEMTGGVLYLLSGQASYTTGTTLVMDGGLSIL